MHEVEPLDGYDPSALTTSLGSWISVVGWGQSPHLAGQAIGRARSSGLFDSGSLLVAESHGRFERDPGAHCNVACAIDQLRTVEEIALPVFIHDPAEPFVVVECLNHAFSTHQVNLTGLSVEASPFHHSSADITVRPAG